MNYNITKIRPKGFLHSSGFNEVIDSLAFALTSLGHQAKILDNWISNDPDEINIIFGAELLAESQPAQLPATSIIYNLEQPTHPNLGRVMAIARSHRVWDYNLTNVANWARWGYNVKHVPIGYTPNLTRIQSTPKDIDVLFLGWLTPRRLEVIQSLKDAGLKVYASDKCYGGGRDNLIARSKICLNIHHDGRTLFEIVRISYLLANRAIVLSEFSDDDAEYKDLNMIVCPYDELVEQCVKLVAGEGISGYTYEEFGEYALDSIKKFDYISSVEKALIEPTPFERVEQRYESACKIGDMVDFAPWLRENAKGTILEIGVRDGGSTSALLAGVQRNGGVVMSVDVIDYNTLFAGHPQWKFIQSDSQNPKLKVPELDMVLIDGDHERGAYRRDLERYYPLVKNGGLIVSHDIKPEPGHEFYAEGIKEEYFDFIAQHQLEHKELPGKYGMGIIYKQ